MSETIELLVNGVKHRVEADSEASLLEVIREDLGLTGTKYGCGESQCGACTVLIGDQAVHSCMASVGDAVGQPITTIEGLEKNGKLHAVQQAFIDHNVMQCGYCCSGMVMAAVGFLEGAKNPSEADIVGHMSGNICRCGGYPRMVAAIKEAADKMGAHK
jgi:aerobic-type carbon monoxide dehydrogenase small subunit (CoxS/CutS family)